MFILLLKYNTFTFNVNHWRCSFEVIVEEKQNNTHILKHKITWKHIPITLSLADLKLPNINENYVLKQT
jgi:hypothetical protein